MHLATSWKFSALSRTLLTSILVIGATTASGLKADNFVLLDHAGDAHELYYHKDAAAIVLVAHQSQCADVSTQAARLATLQAKYEPKGVQFFLLNSSLTDQRSSLFDHVAEMKITAPVLDDETQLIGESLNLANSGETLVINPQTWQVTFRGPIQAKSATTDILSRTIDSHLANQPVEYTEQPVDGCDIQFPHELKDSQQISYSSDIAPILQDKCVVCHTEGGLGPWAMSDYNMVLGFAPMIREVLRTKRMPPWHADPHIGVWKNDISLTNKQLQTLVHWIESGAHRGDGPDPLAEQNVAAVEWPLGQPDLIIDIPEHTVPASGVVDYQFPTVVNPLEDGVWIKAATVVPGDREVVHHILAGTLDADTTDLRRNSGVFDNYLIGYAPGNESHIFPSDTGVFIPPGGDFQFQLHYTPVGRETVDRSRIGLYFHEKTPDNFFRQGVVVNPTISIPPNEARHKEIAYYEFDKEALLHDLVPHAHYRGVASRFEVQRPDGSKELVLNVPNYDFNWQRTYEFIEPKKIQAGSRLIHTTWYDNSTANPGNPDADRQVPWGLQSWDEMLYGAFSYTYVNETTEAPIHDKQRARTTQLVGFLDENLDGKVSWRELPKNIKKRLIQGFSTVDTNGDGGLDIEEMTKVTQRMERARDDKDNSEAGTSATNSPDTHTSQADAR